MTRSDWRRVAAMAGFIVGLHLVGWFTLVAIVAPGHYTTDTRSYGLGVGVTAYALGLRHAFDADHIAAIDNTTRKLMADRQRPLSVGFWFSLGHSSIVFGLALLLSLGIRSVAGQVTDDSSALHLVTGWIGTTVSGVFLYAIAIANLIALRGIWKVMRRLRRGHLDEDAFEQHLDNRGVINRLTGRITRSITKPWQMYPLGLLFGLGFDTATEVALLVVAGSGAASRLPWYAILCLPILFSAGMCLLDTIDGSFMTFAYQWAFSQPLRKIYYNLLITGLTVAVAIAIGTVELLTLFADNTHLDGPFWTALGRLDLNLAGYLVAALLAISWVIALAVTARHRHEPEVPELPAASQKQPVAVQVSPSPHRVTGSHVAE
jgi:high-affinity nickel-transport protein